MSKIVLARALETLMNLSAIRKIILSQLGKRDNYIEEINSR